MTLKIVITLPDDLAHKLQGMAGGGSKDAIVQRLIADAKINGDGAYQPSSS